MIPIRRKNLQQLAERHYESILDYTNKEKPTYIDELENWLQDKFSLTFKELILAKPDKLDEIADTFTQLRKELKEDKNGEEKEKVFIYWDNERITKQINLIPGLYSKFSPKDSSPFKIKTDNGKSDSYNGSVLVESLGLTVCPYCNRNFINTIYRDNIDKPRAIDRRTSQLDHFYPKSIFPILAMSFYNLIPSCMVCNFIKKDISEVNKYYNPYDARFDGNKGFQFKLRITSPEFYYNKDKIEIEYDGLDEQKRISNNLDLFKIKELYNEHKDIVIELIQKDIIYNDSYIDELYKKYEGTLFKNREDVLRLVTSNYIAEDELDKRPLSKLTRDIAEELGLI